MKYFLILFIFLETFLFAQYAPFSGNFSKKPDKYSSFVYDKSIENFYYKLDYTPDKRNSNKKKETTCILQIGKEYSKFYDLNALKKDSLIEKFSHQESIGAKEMNQIFSVQDIWQNTILKSFSSKKTIIQDNAYKYYQYEEDYPSFKWNVLSETKIILGYSCQKATMVFRGRKYVAWYAKDLPINNGPYLFADLPGLILEIEDTKNHFHFIAVAADKKSYDIYLRNEDRILKVTREKFRTVQKSYYDNPGFFIHQGYNADGTAITSRLKSKPYNPIELE